MSINESRIRQIIREEATRTLREGDDDLPGPRFRKGTVKMPGLAAFGDYRGSEDAEEEEDYDEDYDSDEGDEGPRGWTTGGGMGDEPALDSGNSELDSAWDEWVSCTDRVLSMLDDMETNAFPQEDDPSSEVRVSQMMEDYINNR
jgi:hypothetical protein